MHKEHWHEVLPGGTHVLIRSIRKQDVPLERRFLERLSPRSRRFRFLGEVKLGSALLKQLVDIDPSRDVALIALIGKEGEQVEIGVARLCGAADGLTAEFAVIVSDEWHRKGLGTLLIRHLVNCATTRGFKSMTSIDSEGNDLMQKFAKHLGMRRETDPNDATQVLHSLDLTQSVSLKNAVGAVGRFDS